MQNHLTRYRLAYQILFYAVVALGIYLGMRPEPPPTLIKFSSMGTLYHAGGLFVCTILSYLAHPQWRWWWRAALMMAVGIAIEISQIFSTRTADIEEIYANTVGVVLALLVLWIGRCRCRR